MTSILSLAANDLKMIIRDRMLVAVFCLPLPLLLLSAWIIPEISEQFYDLVPYSCLILSFAFIQMAVIFGFVYAFLMIDERDENILSALRVVPVSPAVFILSRLLCATLFAFFYSVLAFVILGLADVPVPDIILISFMFALLAPIIALTIVILSGNKVDAIAVFKGIDLAVLLPLVSLFIQSSWKYIFAIFPHFWTILAFGGLLLSGSLDYLSLSVGLVLQFVLLGGLVYRFSRI
ncbi:MAG: hypothetical protein M0R30_01095 [Methanoregula sp.]|jgi:fluoroquinolone transport system permease protein|uniref:hypothetical protein n=1 Tax=Methanoregula sp. TaxID=2052170 RepID=UPI0025D585F7|nr:hypothetical protein [Methanoregula sp.]MCK9630211.1 hypothetical protein [Methanoregula sp.]